MKTGWTPVQWNNAIWLALRYCHVSMTCKINKSEIPDRPFSFFHALFGRCTAFYGHFLVDVVTSEGSTSISHHQLPECQGTPCSRKVRRWSDCNWTRTQNHLVLKRTLNTRTKWPNGWVFGQMVSVHLRTKWLWVRVQLQSLKMTL